MIFHENGLLADDSHEISYLNFFRKLRKMSQNLSSAAVLIDTLRVNLNITSLKACLKRNHYLSEFCDIRIHHLFICSLFEEV